MTSLSSTFRCPRGAELAIEAQVTDLRKPKAKILTGIGFLDHMLDQFNSHAQIGIAVSVKETSQDEKCNDLAALAEHGNLNRLAQHDQVDQSAIFTQIGQLLGSEFHRILTENKIEPGATSFFGCPLDEALVLVQLKRVSDNNEAGLTHFNLAPYGCFPPTGRTHLGKMELQPLEPFWEQVAAKAKLQVSFSKIHGDNAHHVVEAAFKAFSRALRNLVDGVDTVSTTSTLNQLYGPESDNAKASRALNRVGSVKRQTKETSIEADLALDGGAKGSRVSMGLATLNDFWMTVAQEARVSLNVNCQGDLWIDEHHTAEDVAIALGQVWNEALGSKAGLNRMWCAQSAKVLVVLDLSNRPMLTHNLPLKQHPTELLGDVPVEMLEHVLDSFTVNARVTLQIHVQPDNDNEVKLEDAWPALAVALGQALRYCIMVDQRRAGATASSKGTLSV